jgi:hypothetical protein
MHCGSSGPLHFLSPSSELNLVQSFGPSATFGKFAHKNSFGMLESLNFYQSVLFFRTSNATKALCELVSRLENP